MESRERHSAAASSSSSRPLLLSPSWTSPRDKWVFSSHKHMVFGPLMEETAGAASTCWGKGFCKQDYLPAHDWAEAARGQFSGCSGYAYPRVLDGFAGNFWLLSPESAEEKVWPKPWPKISPPLISGIEYSAKILLYRRLLFHINSLFHRLYIHFLLVSVSPSQFQMQEKCTKVYQT